MQKMHFLHRKSEAYSVFVGESEFSDPVRLTAQVLKFSIYSQKRRNSMAVSSPLSHRCTSVLEAPELRKQEN